MTSSTIGEPQPGTPQQTRCPNCRASIPSDPRFVTWCDRCGWNVRPQEAVRTRGLVETLYARMGQRLGKSLYESVRRRPDRSGSLTFSRVLAFLIAACVHLVTVVCVVGGVLLIATHWFHVVPVLAGVVLLALAGFLRPRFSRVPKKIVPRETLPTWYRVADEVARAVGAAPVHGIILTADFNASFSQPGFPRRKTVLRLGLPLLTVLDTEERIALLGHELAHGANGDPRRGFVVGSAVDTLARWYWLLRPEQIFDDSLTGLAWLGGVLGSIASLALSVIPWSIAFVLVHLFWRDSQRAEYLADRLAVRVAGTAAMLRLLDALHLGSTVHFTMQRAVLSPTGGGDIFADVRESVASLPERERERIRRVERLEGSQLDATHPPTAFRIDLIGSNPVQRPAVSVNATDARALDDELTPFQPAVHSALLDRYRRRLYY